MFQDLACVNTFHLFFCLVSSPGAGGLSLFSSSIIGEHRGVQTCRSHVACIGRPPQRSTTAHLGHRGEQNKTNPRPCIVHRASPLTVSSPEAVYPVPVRATAQKAWRSRQCLFFVNLLPRNSGNYCPKAICRRQQRAQSCCPPFSGAFLNITANSIAVYIPKFASS